MTKSEERKPDHRQSGVYDQIYSAQREAKEKRRGETGQEDIKGLNTSHIRFQSACQSC